VNREAELRAPSRVACSDLLAFGIGLKVAALRTPKRLHLVQIAIGRLSALPKGALRFALNPGSYKNRPMPMIRDEPLLHQVAATKTFGSCVHRDG